MGRPTPKPAIRRRYNVSHIHECRAIRRARPVVPRRAHLHAPHAAARARSDGTGRPKHGVFQYPNIGRVIVSQHTLTSPLTFFESRICDLSCNGWGRTRPLRPSHANCPLETRRCCTIRQPAYASIRSTVLIQHGQANCLAASAHHSRVGHISHRTCHLSSAQQHTYLCHFSSTKAQHFVAKWVPFPKSITCASGRQVVVRASYATGQSALLGLTFATTRSTIATPDLVERPMV